MKKTLLALAIANVATVVNAGSVQLYGNIDVGVESAKYSSTGTTNRVQSGQSVGSSIGFKGTEDICEDVKAVFNVEAGFSADNGRFTNHFDTGGLTNGQDSSSLLDNNVKQTQNQQLFARQAYAGLRTKVGQITLGRQYTPVYEAAYSFDPFQAGTVGSPSSLLLGQSVLTNNPNLRVSPVSVSGQTVVGVDANGNSITRFESSINQAASAYPIRANNSIVYRFMTEEKGFIPALKGAVMYGAGNELSGQGNGQGVSGRDVGFNVGFTLKGVDLMASTHRTDVRNVINSTSPSTFEGKQRNDFYGAAYTLKLAGREYKATAGYNRASFTRMSGAQKTSAVTWLGATTQLGANGTLKFMGARLNDKSTYNLDATQFSVGYDHKLSKRTTVYSAYSKINNKNGAFYTFNTATLTGQDVDGGFSPRAFNFGIRHAF